MNRRVENIAVLDLGSNSFHLIIARVEDGAISPLLRLRESLALANGLSEDGSLAEPFRIRAISALARLSRRIRGLNITNIIMVATGIFRETKDIDDLLQEMAVIVGVPVRVISGLEEARLIYLGVTRTLEENCGQHLVVDLGGGSTELILGAGETASHMASINLGCVRFTTKYFPDGDTCAEHFQQAEAAAAAIFEEHRNDFTSSCPAIGVSGTIRATSNILRGIDPSCEGVITLERLEMLRDRLIKAKNSADHDLPGLRADRVRVYPGGLAIFIAMFRSLNISFMTSSEAGLREGVIYDHLS